MSFLNPGNFLHRALGNDSTHIEAVVGFPVHMESKPQFCISLKGKYCLRILFLNAKLVVSSN